MTQKTIRMQTQIAVTSQNCQSFPFHRVHEVEPCLVTLMLLGLGPSWQRYFCVWPEMMLQYVPTGEAEYIPLIPSENPFQEAKRTCTIRNGQPSHQVDGYALLNCKNCHASKCYQHILSTLNIHSSQAILVYYMTESSSDAWHKYHVELKHSYLESYPQLLSNMVSGSYHPLNHRLTYFALHFTATDPVSRNTERGFYDVDEVVVGGSSHPCTIPDVIPA